MGTTRPFFGYYGGKWMIAPRYPAPTFDRIVEPFAGSAGYSVRHHTRAVSLYDVDEQVCGTWEYLIRTSADEIRHLPLFDGSWESVDDLQVCQEARWLIGWWLNRATTHPCKTPSAWMRQYADCGSFWSARVRERVARQVDLIRHWTVTRASWENVPEIPGTWFVDPPYSNSAGRRYRHNSLDFAALGAWCKDLPGQVIVCENVGADWLPFDHFHDAKATSIKGRTAHVSREAMWYSPGI